VAIQKTGKAQGKARVRGPNVDAEAADVFGMDCETAQAVLERFCSQSGFQV